MLAAGHADSQNACGECVGRPMGAALAIPASPGGSKNPTASALRSVKVMWRRLARRRCILESQENSVYGHITRPTASHGSFPGPLTPCWSAMRARTCTESVSHAVVCQIRHTLVVVFGSDTFHIRVTLLE